MPKPTKIKLVVLNENTLGYIQPELPNICCVLRASILRGAVFEVLPSSKLISRFDTIRLASKADFEEYRVSFVGYEGSGEYEYDRG